MNHITIIGRLTKDPEIRYSQGANGSVAYGNYTIAVDRPKRSDAETVTDFIYCKVVGKTAEFAEKYLRKGMKIAIEGRLQVDNFTDQNGNKRSTTYVQVSQHEFCESRNGNNASGSVTPNAKPDDAFMDVPDSVFDEGLPF